MIERQLLAVDGHGEKIFFPRRRRNYLGRAANHYNCTDANGRRFIFLPPGIRMRRNCFSFVTLPEVE